MRTRLLPIVFGLAAVGPGSMASATPPPAATPMATLRAMPLAERCAAAEVLADEVMNDAVRTKRVDDFFEKRRAQLVVFLDHSTGDAAKLIASTERCEPVQRIRLDDLERTVWTIDIAGQEHRGDRQAFVLHLEDAFEQEGPRLHFSWKTNEPYPGNDRPSPPTTTTTTTTTTPTM